MVMLLRSPMRGVAPLLNGIRKLQSSAEHFTILHPDFLLLCLSAKCYKSVLSILEDDIYEVDHLKDLLLYGYYGSMDTRKIFVDPLCIALNLDGIPTFFYDSDQLESGQEIVSSAIVVSKIIIVVLSTNYASSTCLDQLVKILESKKRTTKQKVFPVFYDVDPEDVRQQTGEFGTAFRQHTAMKNLKEVETWKAALAAIGCLSGMDKSVLLPSSKVGTRNKKKRKD